MKRKLLGCSTIFLILLLGPCGYVGYHGITNGRVGVETDYNSSALKATPPQKWAQSHTLKIVTFNIQDLMVVSSDRPERMRAIAAKLMVLDPDIVGFQESFIEKDRQLLMDELEHTRLQHHQYYASASMGSGLLISSAFPIEEVYFHRYSVANPWWKLWEGDWWAGKGVGLARIKISDGHYLDFFNTHAQAGYGNPAYKIVREEQMREAAEFINGAQCATVPVFFVGDLNCQPGDPDYQAVYEGANLERVMTIDSRIDHILAVKSPDYAYEVLGTDKVQEVVKVNGKQFTLSDHNGYLSTIKISPR